MPTIDEGLLGRPRLRRPVRYGISHRRLRPDLPLETYLTRLFEASCDILQLREKDLGPAVLEPLVGLGAELARRTGKVFLVNSAVGLALSGGADGVHLTSRGDTALVRSLVERAGRRDFIVGKSVHGRDEALRAETEGADYLLLAPVFEPLSKEGAGALGLDLLRRICHEVGIPTFALGGITEANAASVLEAGAAGFAGITWLHRELGRGGT